MRHSATALALVTLGPTVALGWPGAGSAVPPRSSDSLVQLRDAARDALQPSCGRCHDGARSTALPKALRIFDLHQPDWSATVTSEQMDQMVRRFEGFHMPAADRVTVQRFIDAERARRAGRTEG
jgi:hypothetical protein